MAIKKNLTVRLLAGGDVVAESNDAKLWAQVFGAITGGSPEELKTKGKKSGCREAVRKFAEDMGVGQGVLEGACSPSLDEPYLHLDKHYWEAFQKNHSVRGRGAVGPLQIAATLLALWFECAGLGKPNGKQAIAVLDTINLTDSNYRRTLARCPWLQYRSKQIRINPAEISKAVAFAKAYCEKQPLEIDAS